jgi:hypothetical protein
MNRKHLIALACGALLAGSAFASTPVSAPAAQNSHASAADSVKSRKVVQVGNDVVIVSLVAAPGETAANNVGITRYNAAGEPVAWSKSGSWTDAAGQNIVFPKSAWHFTAIRDAQVFKDHVWILADSATIDSDGQPKHTTDILAFDTSGEFKGGRFNVIRPEVTRDVVGAGMVFSSATGAKGADQLLVVAGCPDFAAASDDRLCVQRYLLSTRDQWYPSFASDGKNEESNWYLKSVSAQ